MDAGRDDEDQVMNIIFTDGDAGEDVSDDFGSQFLNDYGEGVDLEQSEEVPS